MLIELRAMQAKLRLDSKEVKKLVVPLLAVRDSLTYLPDSPIVLKHIPGKTNPADAFTKPVDVSILVDRFMVTCS